MRFLRLYVILLFVILVFPLLVARSNATGQLSVTVYTDKQSYDPGEPVSITGQVLDQSLTGVSFASVSIQANDPSGNPIHVAMVLSSADGSYADQFKAPPNPINGGYAVYVTASKPGYTDAYTQTACIITPEFRASHTTWLVLFLGLLVAVIGKRARDSSKSTCENGKPSVHVSRNGDEKSRANLAQTSHSESACL